MGYDFMAGEYHNINSGAPPFGNRSLITDPPGGMDDPNANPLGMQIGYFPSAMSIVVKGTSLIHQRVTRPIQGVRVLSNSQPLLIEQASIVTCIEDINRPVSDGVHRKLA